MPRVTRLACRAIDATCWPVGRTAWRLIAWSAARKQQVLVPPFPAWADAAADSRQDRWAGPHDYSQSADHDDVVRCMNRDGIGR
jgi:hypothetical protein